MRQVFIRNRKFTKRAFSVICEATQLEKLAIIVEPAMPRESYAEIVKLKNLKMLSISSRKVDSLMLSRFTKLPELESLRLYNVKVNPLAVRKLAEIRKLHYLDLSFIEYNADTLKEIFKLKQLKSLRIGSFHQSGDNRKFITGEPLDLTDVTQLRDLVSLELHHIRMTDESWQAIGELRGLRRFGIWE